LRRVLSATCHSRKKEKRQQTVRWKKRISSAISAKIPNNHTSANDKSAQAGCRRPFGKDAAIEIVKKTRRSEKEIVLREKNHFNIQTLATKVRSLERA
jgi:hypothetical protein